MEVSNEMLSVVHCRQLHFSLLHFLNWTRLTWSAATTLDVLTEWIQLPRPVQVHITLHLVHSITAFVS